MDGRITGKEVKEVILLSASANKLSKLKDQAAECAALIMDELDKDQHGYIEVLFYGPASVAFYDRLHSSLPENESDHCSIDSR